MKEKSIDRGKTQKVHIHSFNRSLRKKEPPPPTHKIKKEKKKKRKKKKKEGGRSKTQQKIFLSSGKTQIFRLKEPIKYQAG